MSRLPKTARTPNTSRKSCRCPVTRYRFTSGQFTRSPVKNIWSAPRRSAAASDQTGFPVKSRGVHRDIGRTDRFRRSVCFIFFFLLLSARPLHPPPAYTARRRRRRGDAFNEHRVGQLTCVAASRSRCTRATAFCADRGALLNMDCTVLLCTRLFAARRGRALINLFHTTYGTFSAAHMPAYKICGAAAAGVEGSVESYARRSIGGPARGV